MSLEFNTIHRYKTAIRRPNLSLPVKCLLRDGLLDSTKTLFDYGCGRGQDLVILQDLNIPCEGWDPIYRPTTSKQVSQIVNLGYVINVIEDTQERSETLRSAWDLCKDVLVISAQLTSVAPEKDLPRLNDGILTSRGTFQKYYTQTELRTYIEDVLLCDAIPAAPGIFYVFRNETAKQVFLANRFRRPVNVPNIARHEHQFATNKDILEPFLRSVIELGRLPALEEFDASDELIRRFGSFKRALNLIQKVIQETPWQENSQKRSEDLLVYLALARFHKRPPLTKLPVGTQRDIKSFFGTYEKACQQADALLFQVSDASSIDKACQASFVGQLIENGLLIHRNALGSLSPLLRIYEGCARALLGEYEEAQVIKLHRFSGKVSYLVYTDFDDDPNPILARRVKVNLPSLSIDWIPASGGESCRLTDKERLLEMRCK